MKEHPDYYSEDERCTWCGNYDKANAMLEHPDQAGKFIHEECYDEEIKKSQAESLT